MNHARSFFAAMLVLLASVTASAQDVPAQEKKPASLSGMAINSLTGEPLPHVEVELQRKIPGGSPFYGPALTGYRRAVTGHDGRFSLTGIEAGSYFVSADRNGYHPVDDFSPWDPPMRAVKPGEEIKDILLRLEPDAFIAGRVVGADGAPMEGVGVEAIGHRFSIPCDTDDRGEFVIGGLPPGRYLVRAALDHLRTPEIRKDGSVVVNYYGTYFPNAKTSGGAVPVVARANQETAIEIKMLPGPELHISGNISGDFPDQGVSVGLEDWRGHRASATIDKGKFNLARVLPGRYRLYAATESSMSAAFIVDVNDASIDGIQLRLSAPVELTGQIRDEDWKQIKSLAGTGQGAFEITLRPFGLFISNESYTGTLSAEGSFKFKNVAPGRYHVFMRGAPKTYYVRSLAIGEREFHDGILEIGGGPAQQQVLIELGADGGEVSGIVRDDKGGVGGARVLLLAQDGSLSAYAAGALTSEDGSYVLQGITPGKYKLLALNTKYSTVLVLTDEALELDRNVTEEIEVRAGDRLTQDLKMGAQ